LVKLCLLKVRLLCAGRPGAGGRTMHTDGTL
jgi:hypothetical protein